MRSTTSLCSQLTPNTASHSRPSAPRHISASSCQLQFSSLPQEPQACECPRNQQSTRDAKHPQALYDEHIHAAALPKRVANVACLHLIPDCFGGLPRRVTVIFRSACHAVTQLLPCIPPSCTHSPDLIQGRPAPPHFAHVCCFKVCLSCYH